VLQAAGFLYPRTASINKGTPNSEKKKKKEKLSKVEPKPPPVIEKIYPETMPMEIYISTM
jgi:hypothetical protein